MNHRIFLTDKEVANILSIHPSTISRAIKRRGSKANDVFTKAQPTMIGDMRRWSVKKLAAALQISADEMMECI